MRFVSLCNLQNVLCSFKIADFWPKPDLSSNADPIPNPNFTIILTIVKSCSTFCIPHRLTNCADHHQFISWTDFIHFLAAFSHVLFLGFSLAGLSYMYWLTDSDWLPRLMGPFSVFTVFVGVSSCFWCSRLNWLSSFSAHGIIGNFVVISSSKLVKMLSIGLCVCLYCVCVSGC